MYLVHKQDVACTADCSKHLAIWAPLQGHDATPHHAHLLQLLRVHVQEQQLTRGQADADGVQLQAEAKAGDSTGGSSIFEGNEPPPLHLASSRAQTQGCFIPPGI